MADNLYAWGDSRSTPPPTAGQFEVELKAKITKAEHTALGEEVRKLYRMDWKDADVYHLDVEGCHADERQAVLDFFNAIRSAERAPIGC